tara:strand:- start:65 stop:382 length:318 start_codon:yes stop_codon:yes gene_type:complete
MTLLQQIRNAQKECRKKVEIWSEFPFLRAGEWLLGVTVDGEVYDSEEYGGAVTLKDINEYKSREHPKGASFFIEGRYEAHSHLNYSHEYHEINYDGIEYWSVDFE